MSIRVSDSIATYCDSCHSNGELVHIRIGDLSRRNRNRSLWVCEQCASDLAHKLVEKLYEKARNARSPESSETLLHVSPPLAR